MAGHNGRGALPCGYLARIGGSAAAPGAPFRPAYLLFRAALEARSTGRPPGVGTLPEPSGAGVTMREDT